MDAMMACPLGITVCVFLLLGFQFHCTGYCLVQQNGIGDVYTAVQVHIAVEGQSALAAF